jgi:phage replication O-like protein O
MTEENYTKVSNFIFDPGGIMAMLNGSEFKVFLAIWRKTKGFHQESDHISFSQFQEMTGIHSEALTNAINSLEDAGFIQVEKAKGKTSLYSLATSQSELLRKSKYFDNRRGSTSKTEEDHFEKRRGTTSKIEDTKEKKETNKETNKERTCYPFQDFWDDYDKKVDKQKAKKRYRKLDEKERQAIKEFIPYYKVHQPDAQFRKHPTTFLNNRSWEDQWIVKEAQKKKNGTTSKNKNFETAQKAVAAFEKLNFDED